MTKFYSTLIGALWLCSPILTAHAQQMPPGMVKYQMVFLRNAANTNLPPAETSKMQEAHLALLAKLNRERVNLLYGHFLDKTDLRGIVVLDLPDAEAARKALAEDPLVQTGHFLVDVKPWLCQTNMFSLPETPSVPEQLVFGFLMRGTNPTQVVAGAENIQAGHLAYMGELHKQGKLLAAGPFADRSDWPGIVIYRDGSVEEARTLAAGDPAVKAGRLTLDARPWMTFKGILK